MEFTDCHQVQVRYPTTVEEVQDIVKEALGATPTLRVKVVGAGHSWAPVADPSGGIQVSLDRMDRVLNVDEETNLVTMEAGIRLSEMFDFLASLETPLTLPNAPSTNEQSISGALATCSHGSGMTHACMATYVRSLEVVTAEPGAPPYTLSKDENPEWFSHARGGLGVLGIVTKVTLECVPAFRLRSFEFSVYTDFLYSRLDDEPLPPPGWPSIAWGSDIAPVGITDPTAESTMVRPDVAKFPAGGRGLRALAQQYEFLKVWAIPHTEYTLVHAIERVAGATGAAAVEARTDSRGLVWNEMASYVAELFGLVGERWPRTQGFFNNLSFWTSFLVPLRREGRSDAVQVIPYRVPYHTELEYSVPAQFGALLMRQFKHEMDTNGLTTGFIHEVRHVAPDNVPLSPDYGSEPRLHITLGLFGPSEEHMRSYFTAFERLALPLGGRPHWAKRFFATPSQLRAVYPRWDNFLAVRQQMDPRGVFLNEYMRATLGVTTTE